MSASRGSRRPEDAGHVTDLVYSRGTESGTGIVVGVFVALLILFFWLHFIVAQENESIGRAIHAQTEELARIERENMALRQQIAAASAEATISERALALGYRPQQPLYLLLSRPLVPAARGSRTDALLLPSVFRDPPPAGATDPGAGEGSTTGAEGRP